MQVSKVEIIPLKIGFKFKVLTAKGVSVGMPILARVYTDEGIVGVGDARPGTPVQSEHMFGVIAALRDFYAPLLIGEDPLDVNRVFDKMDSVLPQNMYARAIINHALLDVVGKFFNVPLYKLMGGLRHEKIPVSMLIGIKETRERCKEALTLIEDFGLKYFRLKAGPTERWKEDVKDFCAIRDTVGNDVNLQIDMNGTYTASMAIKAIKLMEKYDLELVEQPVPPEDIDGLVRVARSVETPICVDESLHTLHDAYEIIRNGAADVLNVKLEKVGGFTNAIKIAAVADSADRQVYVGSTAGTGLSAAAGAHYYASTKNVFPAGEFLFGPYVLDTDLLREEDKFRIRNGSIEPPKKPGLGVELDEEIVKERQIRRYVVGK